MPPSDAWERFARADAAVHDRARDAAVRRYVREELSPFSKHYRAAFERAGFDARGVRGAADLAALPATTPGDLLRAQALEAHRTDFLLRPTADAVKAEWSFGRKFLLGVGGRRAHAQLGRTYLPCTRTREAALGPGDDADGEVVVEHTRSDLELLGEFGARAFGLLGLDRPSERTLSLVSGAAASGPAAATGIDAWAVLQAGWQSGAHVAHDLDPRDAARVAEYAPTAVIGAADAVLAFLEAARGSSAIRPRTAVLLGVGVALETKRRVADALAALGAEDPVVCRAFTSGLARALLVEPPADVDAEPGFVTSPDLALYELVRPGTTEPAADGERAELLLSTLAARGTAVLRYRTGLAATAPLARTRCPWSSTTLPRLPSDLAPL